MKWENLIRDWQQDTVDWLRHAGPRLLVVLIIAFLLVRLVRLLAHRLVRFSEKHKTTRDRAHQMYQLQTLAAVVNSVGSAVIVFIAAMELLPLFGIDMKPLLASAGIAGLAIGFGAQTLVKDVINGFFVLIENQYHLGDTIRTAGVKGVVEDMTLRHTVLRDADGTLHFIPNSEIKIISNLTRDWTQLSLHVAVDYNEKSDRVIELLKQAAEEVAADRNYSELIVATPDVPGIERISGQEVDYLMLVKTRPGEHFGVSRALRRAIKECFEKNGIKIAAPTRIVLADSGRLASEEID